MMIGVTTFLVVVAVVVSAASGASPRHPHVIFMVADDLGWNDIGFHNDQIYTPNLDQLAHSGIILNHSYVQPLCSPSRSAFMTGFYPFRNGLQHLVIFDSQGVCVPLNRTMLPQVMKSNGYSTHMVGKWHLGFCKWECTPNYRGFDSFLGYYGAREGYYNKSWLGYDFRENKNLDRDAAGPYSSYQYGDRVVDLIHNHNTSDSFFLYFPIQSVHEPLEVPEQYYNLYPNIKNKGRRTFSGMVTAMDDVVGRMVTALKSMGMYEDTIIFFTADNGGWTAYHGNNYPLRGGKVTIWEGGTRVPGFVHYPKLNKTGVQHDGLMHAVDWFSTITEAAGINYKDPDSDGVSQWQAITTQAKSPRNEFVYNLDYLGIALEGRSAIRVGDFKLIEGFPGLYDGWYKPQTEWTGRMPRSDYSDAALLLSEVPNAWMNFRGLYNLTDDPYERTNLYDSRPDVVKQLQSRLEYYITKMVPANFPPRTPASDPKNFGGAWTPGWC